jgi:hypothetical protein
MASVGLWTPVTYQPFVPPTFGKWLLENCDSYFCCNGVKVCVIPGREIGKSEGVIRFSEPVSRTALKVASYCTLIIPALVFVAKLILRTIYTFHVIVARDLLAESDNYIGGINPPSRSQIQANKPGMLEVDKLYRLSCDETAKLMIQATVPIFGHDLPQMNTEHYSVPPGVNIGISKLEIYNDSHFEWEYKGRYSRKADKIVDSYYEIVRRKNVDGLNLLPTGKDFELTVEQVIDLKLVPIEGDFAVSMREEYNDSHFWCTFNRGRDNYTVRRIPSERPFLPFNRAVRLDGAWMQRLNPTYAENEIGNGWRQCYLAQEEYKNFAVFVKETQGGCIVVRMLPSH